MTGREATRVEEVGQWMVYTYFDDHGIELRSVGYPKRPLVSEEALRASLEHDEMYLAETRAG